MGKIVESAIAYFKRAVVSQAPRPLLLTGAKGGGKTSLAKLIGDRLESDQELLTGALTLHHLESAHLRGILHRRRPCKCGGADWHDQGEDEFLDRRRRQKEPLLDYFRWTGCPPTARE